MAVKNLKRGQLTRPKQRTMKMERYLVPLRGIDFRTSLTKPDPEICVSAFNLVSHDGGMVVRSGYREWAIGLDLGASVGVHTIIPFDGLDADGQQNRLFAVTNEGIWDATTAGAPPTLKFTFADQQVDAGYGTYTHYIDDSGEAILFYADSRNGLFNYTLNSDAWVQTTSITGPVIENVRFIVTHKQRIWLIEEATTKAWYLPVGSHSGMATEFFFGSKFKHGGNLEGLFNWTIDGGDGVDDILVAVSRAGDVLPYKGSDPSIVEGGDAWGLVGTYFIGEVPRGPSFGSDHGGELVLLSAKGLTSMNDLLQGVNRDNDRGGLAAPVSASIRRRIQASVNEFGWQVQSLPDIQGLVINSPRINNGPFTQYFYSYTTQAWGILQDVPANAFDSYQGSVAFGDADSRVLYMDVGADNVLLTPPVDQLNGDDVNFSILTTFQPLDSAGIYKKVHLIRPDFAALSTPAYFAFARYDFDTSVDIPPASAPLLGEGLWDTGVWDTSVWEAGEVANFNSVAGVWGYGRYVAISMTGRSRVKTEFLGWDVMYSIGGPMI